MILQNADLSIYKKTNLAECTLLELIFSYFWFNKLTKNTFDDDKNKYQWFSLKMLSEKSKISIRHIQKIINKLCLENILIKKNLKNKMYLSINFDEYIKILNTDEEYTRNRIDLIIKKYNVSYNNECEGMKMQDSLVINECKYKFCENKYAFSICESLVKKARRKNFRYFTHYFSENCLKKTKLIDNACRFIIDIYNGNFVKSRYYDFDDVVFNNKSFDTTGWKEKINSVKGDWGAVRKLIFNAFENYELMHDENRMPFNKNFLPKNLNDWFCSYKSGEKPQSCFIQCLNEPSLTTNKFVEDKAKRLRKELEDEDHYIMTVCGDKLLQLMPKNTNKVSFWKCIRNMWEWFDYVYCTDKTGHYAFADIEDSEYAHYYTPEILMHNYFEYIKLNKIGVNIQCVNVKYSLEHNGPFCWFMKDVCKNSGMNDSVLRCFTKSDFVDMFSDFDSDVDIISRRKNKDIESKHKCKSILYDDISDILNSDDEDDYDEDEWLKPVDEISNENDDVPDIAKINAEGFDDYCNAIVQYQLDRLNSKKDEECNKKKVHHTIEEIQSECDDMIKRNDGKKKLKKERQDVDWRHEILIGDEICNIFDKDVV